jgi:hypothetical protein
MSLRLEHDGPITRLLIDRANKRNAVTLSIFAAAFAGADFAESAAAFMERRSPPFGE